MKALMTFLKIDSGEILLDGLNVFENRELLLDKSASVIENMGFYKELTGLNIVCNGSGVVVSQSVSENSSVSSETEIILELK